MVTAVVQRGTLKKGDLLVAGTAYCKVSACVFLYFGEKCVSLFWSLWSLWIWGHLFFLVCFYLFFVIKLSVTTLHLEMWYFGWEVLKIIYKAICMFLWFFFFDYGDYECNNSLCLSFSVFFRTKMMNIWKIIFWNCVGSYRSRVFFPTKRMEILMHVCPVILRSNNNTYDYSDVLVHFLFRP